MSWQSLDPAAKALAEKVLTEGQFTVWRMQIELAPLGLGTRTISLKLRIPRTTVRDRLQAAHLTLLEHGVAMTKDGLYYIKEAA